MQLPSDLTSLSIFYWEKQPFAVEPLIQIIGRAHQLTTLYLLCTWDDRSKAIELEPLLNLTNLHTLRIYIVCMTYLEFSASQIFVISHLPSLTNLQCDK